MATQAQLAAVQQLYVGYLGRAADSAGQQFWANAIANGTATIASVATGFTLSAEYKAAYGGLTTDALVEKVYNNVLGRTPDAEGKAFWVAALASGKVTADTLVATIVTNLGALDQQTINNKVFVAQTYTDTAGANYNVAAGTASIVGVDSTAASVATAIGSISNGTLPGLVPGQGLIAAQQAAKAAIATYEKEVATANASLDVNKNGSATALEVGGVKDALVVERDVIANGGTAPVLPAKAPTTAELGGAAVTAKGTLDAAKAAFGAAPTVVAAIAAYDTAFAAKVSAADVTANTAAMDAAVAGLNTSFGAGHAVWTALDGKIATDGLIDSAGTLFAALTNLLVASDDRALLVAEVTAKAGAYGTQLVAAADKKLAIDKADQAIITAKAALLAASDSTKTDAYAIAVTNNATAVETLTKTQAADAKVAAVQVILDKFTALVKADTDAGNAVAAFSDISTDKISIFDVQKAGFTGTEATAGNSDIFYFSSGKVLASNDVSITNFAAGDNLVLGSAYSFNSGALSTGNHTALEVFFVKTATGTNVLVESNAVGSATTVVNAATGAVSSHADVAVIELVGVSADHLSFSNGVVSYV